jgi:hypothetical protein
MSITRAGETVFLSGRCGVEDAEALLGHLAGGAGRVDLGGCEHLHAAILQLLMAAGPELEDRLPDFIARWGPFGSAPRAPGRTESD